MTLFELLRNSLVLNIIPKNRYPDVGDWHDGFVYAVAMFDARSEALVLIHELVEYFLCTMAGITAVQVDEDDAAVLRGIMKPTKQRCWKQHKQAERVEKLLCRFFGMSWSYHTKIVDSAFERQMQLHAKEWKIPTNRATLILSKY